MEHYQKLDAVLKHFSKHQRFISHKHMMDSKIIPAAEEAEYLKLIQILVEQKLIKTFNANYDEKGKPLPPTLYQITASGMEFAKNDSFKGVHEKEVLYHHPELRQTSPKPVPSPKPIPPPPNSDSAPKPPVVSQTKPSGAPAVPEKPMNMKMIYWIGGVVLVGLILWYVFTR